MDTSLRETAAAWLSSKGRSETEVQRILGQVEASESVEQPGYRLDLREASPQMLAVLRRRITRAEEQNRQLAQRLGVRVSLDGRAPAGDYGASLRDVPTTQESGKRLQENLRRIYGSMGRPDDAAQRLAEAGSSEFMAPAPGTELVDYFKRIYGDTPEGRLLAEAAAKGRS